MGLRMRVAASACLLNSGLIIAGLGGALAFAQPGHDGGGSDGGRQTHSSADRGSDGRRADDESRRGDRDALGPGGRHGTTSEDNRGEGETPDTPDTPDRTETPKPTDPTKPEEPCPPSETPPSEPPEVSVGDGGGGGLAARPSGPAAPLEMQLPPSLWADAPQLDVAVIEAAPEVAAAPPAPLVPIGLPVIVVAPMPLGDAGGPAATLPAPSLPTAPKSVIVEPPAVQEPLPANEGNIAAVSDTFRIGYVDYLRTAQMSQLVAVALPGVAGLLLLTGAGGFVGYRQAKAGHVHAGAARFMG